MVFLSLFISTCSKSFLSLYKNDKIYFQIGLDSTIVDIVYPHAVMEARAPETAIVKGGQIFGSPILSLFIRISVGGGAPPLYRHHYTKHSLVQNTRNGEMVKTPTTTTDDERRVGTYLKGFQAYLKWLRIPHICAKVRFRKRKR